MIKKILQLLKRTLTRPEGLTLNSIGPVSRSFGEDRGTPIDRYYIEKFLAEKSGLITGTVLEIADSKYSRKFGQHVSSFEVLHVDQTNPNTTIIGDLTMPEGLPENKIDCFVCTQTINFIYDYTQALRGAHRMLKPGGYLLATLAGPSQVSRYDMDRWGDYWRFTTLSALKIMEAAFGKGNVEVNFYGNCLSAISLLRGIAAEEMAEQELDVKDPDYELIITVIAKKAG